MEGGDGVLLVELVNEIEQLALHALDALHSYYDSNTNLGILIVIPRHPCRNTSFRFYLEGDACWLSLLPAEEGNIICARYSLLSAIISSR